MIQRREAARRTVGAARTHEQRQLLEAALDRLLSAVDGILASLDQLDGDPDLEAACEDEGEDTDSEPDPYHLCNWQDEGDQTRLLSLRSN